MTQPDKYHGGLIFFDAHEQGLDGYCRIVAATLEDYGHPVDRQNIQSPDQACVTAHAYAVRLTLHRGCNTGAYPARRVDEFAPQSPDSPANERLELALIPVEPPHDDGQNAQLLLLVMLYRMIEAYGARQVEWLDPATVLPAGRFMSAFAHVSPRRVRSRQEILHVDDPRLAAIKDAALVAPICHAAVSAPQSKTIPAGSDLDPDQALARVFRAETGADNTDNTLDDPSETRSVDSDIRRLATWGMTGMVAFISGPVGLSMAAVNLARGEDFRLSTQVLSLTCFVTVASSSTPMANMLALLAI